MRCVVDTVETIYKLQRCWYLSCIFLPHPMETMASNIYSNAFTILHWIKGITIEDCRWQEYCVSNLLYLELKFKVLAWFLRYFTPYPLYQTAFKSFSSSNSLPITFSFLFPTYLRNEQHASWSLIRTKQNSTVIIWSKTPELKAKLSGWPWVSWLTARYC